MTTFEFVSVLMSIVVGLGITRILSDLASLAEFRANVRFDGITFVWTLNVLGYHLIYWWVVVNNWRTRETWSFAGFAALFLYGVALYFCAALVLPRATDKELDLKDRFESIRTPFFSLWLVVLLSEVIDSLLKGVDYVLGELGTPYVLLISLTGILTVSATRIRNRRFHWAFAVGIMVGNLGWVLYRFSEI
jgi:hypothetical protein